MRQTAMLLLQTFLGGMRAGRQAEDAGEETTGRGQSAPLIVVVVAVRSVISYNLVTCVRLRVQVGVVRGDQLISLSDAQVQRRAGRGSLGEGRCIGKRVPFSRE